MRNKLPLGLLLVFSLSFSSCEESEEINFVSNPELVASGKSIAKNSFAVLSGELKKAMQKGGPVAGIDVCNQKAMPITDSLSNSFGVKIKRTSLKLRNTLNAPDNKEALILEKWESLDVDSLKPVLFKVKDGTKFMAPIKLQSVCLNCHGDPNSLNEDIKNILKQKYPEDKATGYKPGELRGAWVIEFKE